MSHRILTRCAIAALLAAAWSAPARAADNAPSLENLQTQVELLNQMMKEKDRRIDRLEQKLQSLEAAAPNPAPEKVRQDALDAMLRDIEAKSGPAATAGSASLDVFNTRVGGANIRLIDVSLDVLFAGGTSTATDAQLADLQGGGHDPHQRGFTLSQAELSLTGAVDPYLYGEAHIIFLVDPTSGETETELEEAFLTTQSLPWGLQVKAGHFFSKFGLINPLHPHAWDWIDQPIINTRVFGGDGMRQSGVQLAWLTPLPWYSELFVSVQNATGETMPSFLSAEEAIGGRPFDDHGGVRALGDMVYTLHWSNAWELTDELSLLLGGSGAFGANATGGGADTVIYGGDMKLKWKPVANDHGWPFVVWQTEVIGRHYDADAAIHPGTDGTLGTIDDTMLPSDTLHDWGFYTQLLYGFHRDWAAGVRYEYVTGSGDSVDEDGLLITHNDDPFRDARHRISPILIWQPTHFSRFRLQYNYDHAAHLDKDAHTVWLGVEFLWGAHPAHSY